MRILLMAPFERGRQHGGSQRATAMAERLEDRGAEVVWQAFPGVSTSMLAKLRTDVLLRPALLDGYPEGEPARSGDFDAVISSHSYLAWHLQEFPRGIARMIDFHNLEWRTLANAAASVRGFRALHPWLQVALMRRFERRALRRCDVASFTSDEEFSWARRLNPPVDLLLVPSVLPRAAEQQALAVVAAGGQAEERLAYIGSLDFPPNVRTLLRFLERNWSAMRSAAPNLRLTIAGRCDERDRVLLDQFEGVEVLGFVEDVAPLLGRSAAMILPVDGWGGTSLRAMYYALAGIRVIGSKAAFRGLPWEMGSVAETPAQWAHAVRLLLDGSLEPDMRTEAARAAAWTLQRDGAPWDRLMTALTSTSVAR